MRDMDRPEPHAGRKTGGKHEGAGLISASPIWAPQETQRVRVMVWHMLMVWVGGGGGGGVDCRGCLCWVNERLAGWCGVWFSFGWTPEKTRRGFDLFVVCKVEGRIYGSLTGPGQDGLSFNDTVRVSGWSVQRLLLLLLLFFLLCGCVCCCCMVVVGQRGCRPPARKASQGLSPLSNDKSTAFPGAVRFVLSVSGGRGWEMRP
jgi:hypothetical protein